MLADSKAPTKSLNGTLTPRVNFVVGSSSIRSTDATQDQESATFSQGLVGLLSYRQLSSSVHGEHSTELLKRNLRGVPRGFDAGVRYNDSDMHVMLLAPVKSSTISAG